MTTEPPLACWACATPSVPDRADRSGYVACPVCGLRFQATGAAPRERYRAAYFEDYRGGDYYATEPVRRHEARVRLELMRRALPGGGRDLLDVGSAAGFLLDEAAAAGWQPVGVEPSPQAAARARTRLGVEVRSGFVEDLDLGGSAYDAVCLWHVLEHIPRPDRVMGQLHAALRAEGRLFIEVPNGASLLARRHASGWFALEPDVHLAQWTPPALRALLERTGFEVLDLRTVPFLAYVPGALRRAPRRALLALRQRRWLRDPHPAGHELLRAVARPR